MDRQSDEYFDPPITDADTRSEDKARRLGWRLAFTRQWHAQRWRRIEDLAKEHGIWDKVAAIMANGSLSGAPGVPYEEPTYAQLLNRTRHRAEAAEKEVRELRSQIENMEEGRISLINCLIEVTRCETLNEALAAVNLQLRGAGVNPETGPQKSEFSWNTNPDDED